MKKPYRFWISIALIVLIVVLLVLALVFDGNITEFVVGAVNMVLLAILVYWLDYTDRTKIDAA